MRIDDLQKIATKAGLKADTLTDLMKVEFAVNFQDEVANYYNENYAYYDKDDLKAWLDEGYKEAEQRVKEWMDGTAAGREWAATQI